MSNYYNDIGGNSKKYNNNAYKNKIKEIKSRELSSRLSEILERLKSSILKSRELFDEFITAAREENFSDSEIDFILKLQLKGLIPETTLRRYRKEFLTNIDNKNNVLEDATVRIAPLAEIDDKNKNIIEDSSYTPSPALEEFRKKHGILVDPVNAKPVELKDQFEDTDNWLTATKDLNVMKQLLEEERDKTDRLEKKIVDLEKITDSLDTIRRGTTTLEFGSEVIPHIKYEFDLQTNKLSLTIDPDAVKAFYRKVYNG